MAERIDIQKMVIGPKNLSATIKIDDSLPLNTSADVEATARVYWLMPEIAEHACFGDGARKFQDVMGDTDLAHLLEHVAVELMSRTHRAGDISCGKTRTCEAERTYEVELTCPDDVLTSAALTQAAWILQWAFSEKNPNTAPDVNAMVDGIVYLVDKSEELEHAQLEETKIQNAHTGEVREEMEKAQHSPSGGANRKKVLADTQTDGGTADVVSAAEDVQTPETSLEAGATTELPVQLGEATDEQQKRIDAEILPFENPHIPGNRPL